MSNNWRALVRMARDRIVSATPSEVELILNVSIVYVKVTQSVKFILGLSSGMSAYLTPSLLWFSLYRSYRAFKSIH